MTKLFQYTNYIDYNELVNKPLINKVVVEGDKSLADYGIQPAGKYAHLNDSGKVPFEELDDSLLGNLKYRGVWDAENNNPELPLVPEKSGEYWIVSNSGERFGIEFTKCDWIIAGENAWQKIDNTDSVRSVNGKVGSVELTAEDIGYKDTTVSEAIDNKQDSLTAGTNIKIEDNVISAEFTEAILDYNLLYHHPSINGVELIGYTSLEDLDIQRTIKAGENVYLTKSESSKMDDTVNVHNASETVKGVARIATDGEITAGTDDFVIVSPKKLKPVTETLEGKISAEESRATGAEQSLGNSKQDKLNDVQLLAVNSGITTELVEQISESKESLEALQESYETLNKTVTENTATIEELQNSLENVYTKAEADEKFLTEHQDLTELETGLSTLQGRVSTINSELETVNQTLSEKVNEETVDTKISTAVSGKANSEDVYVKTETYSSEEIDEKLANVKVDAYTKSETDTKISEAIADKVSETTVDTKISEAVEPLGTRTSSLEVEQEALEARVDSLETTIEHFDEIDVELTSEGWENSGENKYTYHLQNELIKTTRKIDFGLPVPTTRENANNVSKYNLIVLEVNEGELVIEADYKEPVSENLSVNIKIRGK